MSGEFLNLILPSHEECLSHMLVRKATEKLLGVWMKASSKARVRLVASTECIADCELLLTNTAEGNATVWGAIRNARDIAAMLCDLQRLVKMLASQEVEAGDELSTEHGLLQFVESIWSRVPLHLTGAIHPFDASMLTEFMASELMAFQGPVWSDTHENINGAI